MEFQDYYAALGVDKTASAADIKRAYRKLARESHPDLHPGDKKAEARFKTINEAHEVLGNPETRKKYDELGANWKAYEQAGANAPSGGWTGGFPGGSGGYRTMSADEVAEAFGGADPFSDFFHTFFGGDAGEHDIPRSRGGARGGRGRDIEQAVDLTLEEAFAGTTRRVRSTRGGEERTIEVRIPAGVPDGARVRAAGEGGAGRTGQAGDLYLRVHVRPHPVFERRGQDLHVRIDVPLTTAVLGGEVAVPTVSGTPLRLRVPELTPDGRTLRLRGHGMPSVGRPDARGDLLAAVRVQMPRHLSAEARKHFEAIRALDEATRPSTGARKDES